MEDCEANCVVLRSLLGSCLSDINKNVPLWHYGILLTEEEDCSLSYLMNLTINELKQILELCGLITINNNIVKFVRSPSSYGDNFSWPMFLLENSLSNNYFSQMNLSIGNIKEIFILLALVLKVIHKLILNLNFNTKNRKSAELNR